MEITRLETERLELRAISPEDRCAIFENYSDPDVANWFFDQPLSHIEQADQVIDVFLEKAAQSKGLAWTILLKASGEFVGTCSFENFNMPLQGEIGFDLAKKHWGHGYMVEALAEIITYGFTELGLLKIEAHTYSTNTRARRVLDKLGFKVDGVTEGTLRYLLDKSDWMQRHS
jgi:[ribosomal protein S5]-alanine N-acetyltransferase